MTPLSRAAAVAILAAVLAPGLAIQPAAATPQACPAHPFGATATADLLTLGLVDLRPLGFRLGPVAGVRLASSQSGLTSQAPMHSAAAARYLDARLLGAKLPAGALDATAYQNAPPVAAEPDTVTARRVDLGLLAAGTGALRARATWSDAYRCGTSTGPVTESSAALLDAAVLPGVGGGALLRVPNNLASRTSTGLVAHNGSTASTATAAASVADLRLFAGSPAELGVRVVSPPTLRVVGTEVSYASPVLEISGPVIGRQRLDAPGGRLEFAVPPATLTRPLPSSVLGMTSAPVGPAGLLRLPPLPGVPALGTALTGPTNPVGSIGSAVSVRLSIGELEQAKTQTAVRARAASLRLQVLAGGVTVLELTIGLLDVSATAPAARAPGGGGSPGEGCGGAGCGTLPVTGTNAALIAGGAVLLLVAGRFLLLSSRRGGIS